MIFRPPRLPAPVDPLLAALRRWQAARSWARLIREAEGLWRVDVRVLRRLAATELMGLNQEVPRAQRGRVNRWLQRFHAGTRLR
ncbi:MAG: hypothetical protein ACKO3F_18325 [Cyanobium sp.]